MLIRRVEIPPSGRVEVDLPAGVPLFEMLRRVDDSLAVGRDGQIFHVGGSNFARAGEITRCVGCHAGHSMLEVPEDPSWTNVATSASLITSTEFRSRPRGFLGDFFLPDNLVDRRTDGEEAEWASATGGTVEIDLLWSASMRAREVTLYAPAPGETRFGERNQTIDGFKITTSFQRETVQIVNVNERIRPEGTTVQLDPTVEFNALKITIDSSAVNGLYLGQGGVALAEVEVIAKAIAEPTVNFRRGDADCGGDINIGDAIFTISHMFLFGGALCCEAAADVNGDGKLDISDPIAALAFMFLGTEVIPPPFPDCGPSPDQDIICEQALCF